MPTLTPPAPRHARDAVSFHADVPAPWTSETLGAHLLESLPGDEWPASNGAHAERLEVRSIAVYGMELSLEVRRHVDFAGTNPAFDGPWTLVLEYVVIVPATRDAPPAWSERPSRAR